MALRAIILTGSSIGPSRVEAAAAAPGPPRGVIIYLSSASRAVMDASGPAKLAVAASVTAPGNAPGPWRFSPLRTGP
jgi:hypothetical protein